jgi:hypothetical protein
MTIVDTNSAFTFEQAQALIATDADLQAALVKVNSLDFTQLKQKLMEEKRWTPEVCTEVEDLYRRFLALNVRYPGRKVCPTSTIDEFWHAHILDTRAYATDCDRIFGEFLHHYPYFGTRGPSDHDDLEAAFADTIDLFIRHFGIDPTAGTQARACRPQRCP